MASNDNYLETLCDSIGMLNDLKFYYKLSKQKIVLINKKHFLQKCHNNKIIPNTLNVKLNNPIADNVKYILEKCSLLIINQIVKNLKSSIANLIVKIENFKIELFNKYESSKLNLIFLFVDSNLELFYTKMSKIKISKFEHLYLKKYGIKKSKNENFVTNLSNYKLDKIELNVLKLHPKFEITPKILPKTKFVSEIENSLFNCKNYNLKNQIIKTVNNIIDNSKIINQNLKPIEITAIKKLKNNNNIKIFKADKNAGTVILNTNNYYEMLDKMLTDSVYVKIENCIFKTPNKLQNNLKTLVTKLINEEKIPANYKTVLIANSPINPRMYVLPKIHKNPISLRPIVTTVNSITYKLSKFLHSILKNLLPFPDICVKNTDHFISKLNDIKLNHNSLLFSLDVKSLFTSIPIVELKSILYDKLHDVKISDCKNLLTKNDLIELLEISFQENYFSINNNLYYQNDGLFMGHILSPILANLYMSNFLSIAKKIKNFPQFLTLYVDDIFGIFNGTKRQLENFLNEINKIRQDKIIFTLEVENNKKNFLFRLVVN